MVLEPSEGDVRMTRKLMEAGEILGIGVLDHIIVTKNGLLSVEERGLLNS